MEPLWVYDRESDLAGAARADTVRASPNDYPYWFRIKWQETLAASELESATEDQIWILPFLRYGSDYHVGSLCDWVSLKNYIALKPVKVRAEKKEKDESEQGPQVPKSLLEKHPALAKLLGITISEPSSSTSLWARKRYGSGSSSSAVVASFSDADCQEPEDVVQDLDFEEVWRELAEKRAEMEVLYSEKDDFFFQVRGGLWTMVHKKMAANEVRGAASHDLALRWLLQYGLQTTASFGFKAHTEEGAATLAGAWVHRMQYFYSIFKAALDLEYEYSDADRDAYQEELAFVDLRIEHSIHRGETWERCEQIRSFTPHCPVMTFAEAKAKAKRK